MERAPASIAWLFVFVGFRRVRATLVNAKIKILLTLTFFAGRPGMHERHHGREYFRSIFRNESARPGRESNPGSALAWQTRPSLTTAPREEGLRKTSFPSLYIASA